MFISSIYTRSGRLYISLSHPTNALAVSLELLVPSRVILSDTPTLSSYSHTTRYSNGTFGRVRHTKDVIFDMNVKFHSLDDNDLPSEQEFKYIPALELVADADNADALRHQLILPPALPTYRIRSHLQIPTYHYLTRSSLKLPIPTMKSEALTTK